MIIKKNTVFLISLCFLATKVLNSILKTKKGGTFPPLLTIKTVGYITTESLLECHYRYSTAKLGNHYTLL